MATRNGTVKKSALKDYSRPKSGGIIGIALDEGDTLISVALVKKGDEIVLATKQGMAIRFDEADARAMGRNTYGVKGINLMPGDEVVGMVVADPDGALLTVCEKGYGKRTPFGANIAGLEAEDADETAAEETTPEAPPEAPPSDAPAGDEGADDEGTKDRSSMRYRKQRRGGKGVRDIRATERNGPVVGVVSVRDGDDIMLMTAQGMVNRTHVSEIRLIGRNTQGVRIMNLYEGDKIASIAKIANEDQPETAASETAASETATGGPPASGPTAGESPTSEPTTPDEPTPLE
jgi:DNA gyrase subunit A